jgi:ribonucleoside-diphosphate reductase alpha chain
MDNLLPTDYQSFIHKSRYARWLDEEGRRENWDETVDRYFDYMTKWVEEKHNLAITKPELDELREAVLNLEVMPSMRALMTAGAALERNHIAAFNCTYVPLDHTRAFDELLYILMCGTGVGFSVERNNIDKLPIISDTMEETNTTIVVEDSKEGWQKAFRELIALLYGGNIPSWDLSKLRQAGERLKTFGGRSSGPAPLDELFRFTVDKFKKAAGRRLYPIEAHDIACKTGEVVVVGGVRRSALISLSNLNDDQMRHAKSGQWWESEGQRGLANNSATYKHKPDMETFMREWLALVESKSGERGIFNREAAKKKAAENGRRDINHEFGTNPCSEIVLRPNEACNLTEVVVRESDDENSLARKVRLATILGTWQSTLTNFKNVRKIWINNTEEERLLGVSLTGIMDNELLSGRSARYGQNISHVLEDLKAVAVHTNKELAEKLGIPQSTAITCIKPSGTVSQLVDSASGIHARHSRHYIRTVRGDNKDPITQFMIDQGIPHERDVTKPDQTTVFNFPVEAPKNCIDRNAMSAIEQLNMWLLYARHFCEHKPSVTISVRETEWMEVGAWVWDHFDDCSGISFLPHSDHTYQQAPYQDIEPDEYLELKAIMPKRIDWTKLAEYEAEDNTTGTQELSCTAGMCEIVDIAS